MSPLWLAAALLAARASAQPDPPAPADDATRQEQPRHDDSTPTVHGDGLAVVPPAALRPQTEERRSQRTLEDAHRFALTLTPSAGNVDVGLPSVFGIEPTLRAGAVHPFAGSGDMLRASPYAVGILEAGGQRGLEWRAKTSLGVLDTRSQPTPGGAWSWASPASPASPPKDGYSHVSGVESVYLEAGKGFRGPAGTGLSVYAGASGWSALGRQNTDVNVGVAASRQALGGRFTASVDAQAEGGISQMYRNGTYTVTPEGLYTTLSYARSSFASAWKASVETVVRPWTTEVDPSVLFENGRQTLRLGAHEQLSRSPFLPSEHGLIATAARDLSDYVTVNLSASLNQRRYPGAPGAEQPFGQVFVGITLHPRKPAPEVRVSAGPDLPFGSKRFDPSRVGALPDPALARDRLAAAFADAKTYPEFVQAVAGQAKDYQSVLGMLGAIGGTFNDNNYNSTEGNPANADSQEQIYDQLRASWLDGQARKTGVCITQSQFNAELANAVFARDGIAAHAMAATYVVPDKKGTPDGHSLLALVGPDGKVTIQDWDGIRPIGTTDVLEAFRLYQDLQGIPTAYWDFTDPKTGRHVAYQFSPDGMDALNATTVLGTPGAAPAPWNGGIRGNTLTRDAMERSAEAASRRN